MSGRVRGCDKIEVKREVRECWWWTLRDSRGQRKSIRIRGQCMALCRSHCVCVDRVLWRALFGTESGTRLTLLLVDWWRKDEPVT